MQGRYITLNFPLTFLFCSSVWSLINISKSSGIILSQMQYFYLHHWKYFAHENVETIYLQFLISYQSLFTSFILLSHDRSLPFWEWNTIKKTYGSICSINICQSNHSIYLPLSYKRTWRFLKNYFLPEVKVFLPRQS